METRTTQTAISQTNVNGIAVFDNGELAQKRLDVLLAVNADIAREKSLFHTERERNEAALMTYPLSYEKTFALFGLLLGIFPPTAIFIKFLSEKGVLRGEDFWVLGVAAIIILISATVGYFSGRLVGKIVGELEKFSWTLMLIALPFIGILWGALAGGAGGVIIFVFGAIFGAILGAMVGGVALPIFAVVHRLMKKGDLIDRKHFLPLAFGITFIISAFILGL
jgi:hypothetical protein